MTTKPIKRNTSLMPLSREHHDDLLFCWKIRQGIKEGVDNQKMNAYCNWFFENHLSSHMKKEEEEFSKILPKTNVLYLNMVDDHEAIKAALDEINEYPDANNLERFATILTYHIRFEERQLYNYIQKVATADQLDTIAKNLQLNHINHPKWQDEFWTKN